MSTWICTRQNELTHHGIKGMKWGVRRFQNKDGSLTPAGKRRYDEPNIGRKNMGYKVERKPGVNKTPKNQTLSDEERKRRIRRNVMIGVGAAAAALVVIGAMKYRYDSNIKKMSLPLGIQEFNSHKMIAEKLSGTDTIIKKGTKFQRISSMKLEDYTNKGRIIYTSFLKGDNSIYMRDMPENIDQWRRSNIIKDGGKDVYRHRMTMNKDIKVASPRKVLEAYEAVTGNKQPEQYKFMNFMINLVDRDNTENQKFFDYLRKAGYNALVDENDANVYTKKPLILIDADKDIAGVKTDKVGRLNSIISVLMYNDKK